VSSGASPDEGNVVRRAHRERGILAERLVEWHRASSRLDQLLTSLEVQESTHTVELHLRPVRVNTAESFVRDLGRKTASSGEQWLYFTLRSNGDRYAMALPVASSPPPAAASLALYVEVHSRLVAWWLTYAWRARQLSAATETLASADQAIAAAGCGRALLETAAAFGVDARKVADIWREAKAAGQPNLDRDTVAFRQQFIERLNEVQYGGKFDAKAPEAAEVFGRYPRTNVLGAIEKLAKRYRGDLQTDYQWLCNTIHPSLGTALVFAAPPLVHETGMVMQRWLAGVPLRIDSHAAFDEAEFVERSIASATARAAIAALNVLTLTLDAALRVIDDIGLTTGAPGFADFAYWHMLKRGGRNDPCPCRSGQKSKNCIHEWSAPAPAVPESFEAELRSRP